MENEKGERIAKLEYAVFDNHASTLKYQQKQIDANTKTSTDIICHVRGIKKILYALCIGYTASQIGAENALDLLSKVLGI